MERILVVDDEQSMREYLGILLQRAGYAVDVAASGTEALKRVAANRYSLVLSDLNMPGMTGLELLRALQQAAGTDAAVPVVFLTAYGTARSAVEAMREGAADYLLKPCDNDELLITVRRSLRRRALEEENVQLRQELQQKHWFGHLIGGSPAMRPVYELVEQVKDNRINVLLYGESGTGKEMVARAIHYSGSRRQGPFVPVNCGAIAENLIESELFGYKKGAFTGAARDKIGYFQAAHHGTLFLDEVGDMPSLAQVKLLRALAERKVTPVGGVEEVPVDVRLVAASNRDLEHEVAAGRFREDLYYRLNVVRIDLPRLRERTGDVALLAQSFVKELSEEYGKRVLGISPPALALLERHDWPGNVRELRNAMERAVALEASSEISVQVLPRSIRGDAEAPTGPTVDVVDSLPPDGIDLDGVLAETERAWLERALDATGGNKTQAARLLNMSFRSFRYRLKKLGMDDGE